MPAADRESPAEHHVRSRARAGRAPTPRPSPARCSRARWASCWPSSTPCPRGITVSSSDLATAKSDFQSTLDGEISAAVQQSTTVGGSTSFCQSRDRSHLQRQGAARQPPAVRDPGPDPQPGVRREAAGRRGGPFQHRDLRVLRRQQGGVHRGLREPDRDQLPGRRQPGRGPSSMPVPHSPTWPSRARSMPRRQPTAGRWAARTPRRRWNRPSSSRRCRWAGPSRRGRTPAPASGSSTRSPASPSSRSSAARPVVRRELLQATANVDRVSREIIAFAHRSDVSVNPSTGRGTA